MRDIRCFEGASIEISTVKINVCLINFNELISYHKCDKIIDITYKLLRVLKFTIEDILLTSLTLILYHLNDLVRYTYSI